MNMTKDWQELPNHDKAEYFLEIKQDVVKFMHDILLFQISYVNNQKNFPDFQDRTTHSNCEKTKSNYFIAVDPLRQNYLNDTIAEFSIINCQFNYAKKYHLNYLI